MRICLACGKQKQLIELAKQNFLWREIAERLNVSETFLRNELRHEKCLLSESTYIILKSLASVNYDRFIKTKLPETWGQSKGGLSSKLINIKPITIPHHSKNLAEIIGAILGDGNITKISKEKIGTYELQITGDSRYDHEYYNSFLAPVIGQLFSLRVSLTIIEKNHSIRLRVYSKKLVQYFLDNHGLPPGNKINHKVTIPQWIKKDKNYLASCLRGLYDTDGGIYRLSKNTFQVVFTNYNLKLLNDVRKALIQLDIIPSQITKRNKLYITKKSQLKRFLKLIGFKNPRHLAKIQRWNLTAPSSSGQTSLKRRG